MVRSMYSGVSGMKAHQARMDVIGNNIANVNTYGFKGSRATFRDVYYQTLKSASGASGNTAGGGNPSQVGYGAQLGSVDILMGGSSFTMTDNPMDLGIDGEGFFQVQDRDGNVFYTRAGQLRFDSAGNLVDSQRNFVLGVNGNPMGKPYSSDKIRVAVDNVPPTAAFIKTPINEVDIKINAGLNTKDGNVGITIEPGEKMTDGVKATAEVGANGISVKLNPKEVFLNEAELNRAINDAINKVTQEQNGKDHPAGGFTISFDPREAFAAGGLTGEQICSTDFAIQAGKVTGWPTDTVWGGFKPTGKTSDKYSAGASTPPAATDGEFTTFSCTYDNTDPTKPFWSVTAVIGGKDYTGKIDPTRLDEGSFNLVRTDAGVAVADDYIEFARPSYTTLNNLAENGTGTPPVGGTMPALDAEILTKIAAATSTAASVSKALGLASKTFMLEHGTEGGAQDINSLTGITVGPDGVITGQHAVHGTVNIGRIDIATFANPQGLLQSGGNYFSPTANSGKINVTQPGANGGGALATGSLEMSNVDLSREFSDMITTQRGFQANSRMITVSDTMLEELVNLKR